MRALWLPDVLTSAGLDVETYPGWETRGGEFIDIQGPMIHHTGPGSRSALRDLIAKGRSDLRGPLSQLFLDDTGKFTVIASGKSNHAGPGRWQGITSGNSRFIGIECMNAGDGKDIWDAPQLEALAIGSTAILKKLNRDEVWLPGHKEWALPKGRKVDPSFDMFAFRQRVGTLLHGTSPAHPVPIVTVHPVYAMLKKGDTNPSVKKLQKLLGITDDGNFGPKTEAAVMAFQKSHNLLADGKVGPKTWAALGIK